MAHKNKTLNIQQAALHCTSLKLNRIPSGSAFCVCVVLAIGSNADRFTPKFKLSTIIGPISRVLELKLYHADPSPVVDGCTLTWIANPLYWYNLSLPFASRNIMQVWPKPYELSHSCQRIVKTWNFQLFSEKGTQMIWWMKESWLKCFITVTNASRVQLWRNVLPSQLGHLSL